MEEKPKKTRTQANRNADKKYNKKKKSFIVTYTPTDIKESERFQKYIDTTNQSVNEILKSIIKDYLDRKKFY